MEAMAEAMISLSYIARIAAVVRQREFLSAIGQGYFRRGTETFAQQQGRGGDD
jgi:hypothetical protein